MKLLTSPIVRIKVPRWKRVPLTPGTGKGFSSESDGHTVADITVEIDYEALAKLLGPKALRNAKHTSKLQSGAVIVYASNIHREDQ